MVCDCNPATRALIFSFSVIVQADTHVLVLIRVEIIVRKTFYNLHSENMFQTCTRKTFFKLALRNHFSKLASGKCFWKLHSENIFQTYTHKIFLEVALGKHFSKLHSENMFQTCTRKTFFKLCTREHFFKHTTLRQKYERTWRLWWRRPKSVSRFFKNARKHFDLLF